MAPSAKVSGCFKAAMNLSDVEVADILDRADRHAKANPSHTPDSATAAAVREAIIELRGQLGKPGNPTPEAGPAARPAAPVEPPAATPPAALPASPFSGLGGTDARKSITDRIASETQGGFKTKIDAAVNRGELTREQANGLMRMGAQDSRGMRKAKDELLRLQELAAERGKQTEAARKSWEDPDFNHTTGDPKFGELSSEHQRQWTEAVASNRASGDLYEKIAAEDRAVREHPKVDDGDLAPAHLNPDVVRKMESPVPEGMKFHTGADAVNWLAKNLPYKWARAIAEKIRPLVSDIEFHQDVRATDHRVPIAVREAFANDRWAGAAVIFADGRQAVYFPEKTAMTNLVLLHELLHAATQRGLRMADQSVRAELESIQTAVARALRHLSEHAQVTEEGKSAAAFFGDAVDNPDELIAYAYSSPIFRQFLEHMTSDGDFRTLAEEQADSRTERTAERDFATPEEPNLLKRFVDWVRELLGFDPTYREAFDKAVFDNEQAKVAYLAEHLTPDLMTRMDDLFQTILDKQATSTPSDYAALKRQTDATQVAPAKRQSSDRATNVPDRVPGSINIPEFVADQSATGRFKTSIADWMGGWRNKPGMLGFLTLRQIADRFRDTPGVPEFADLSSRMASKSKQLMQEAHVADLPWAQLDEGPKNEMQRLMIETTLAQMWPDRPLDSHTWLKDRDQVGPKVKHDALRKRYDALPEAAKRTFQQVQAKMRKDWEERGRLLSKRIVDAYRAELHRSFPGDRLDAVAQTAVKDRESALQGLSRSTQKSLKSLWSDMDEHGQRLAQMQGPYFPLMRFGEHVVVAKSSDMLHAQDAFDSARERLDSLNADDEAAPEAVTKARKEVKSAEAELQGFKDQEKHYLVEFFESPTEAKARVKQLGEHFSKAGQTMSVYSERREQHFGRIDSVPPTFMKKLEESLSSALPDKDANAVRAAVRDLYIQSMPERSALKAQLRRIGVVGVKDSEMRRAFAAASMRSSWHLSRLEFGHEMNDQLVKLRGGDTDDQRIIGNELTKRLATAFQQDTGHLLTDRLTNLSYLTYLGLSPSFFVVNSTQPWVISMPVMAARHGIKRSSSELMKAFTEVAAAMKQSIAEQKTWRFELNMEKFQGDERRMLEDLFNKGIIDVTIEHDLGSLASGQETGTFGKVMQFSTLPAHHTEVVNRVMTALASYRLERGDLNKDHETATKYAEKVVADTHLDYTPENAPRFMRSAALGGLGRIVFQFKKYTQGMTFLLAKNARDAWKGDRESGKALVYLLGMQLATAGAVGLPLAGPVSALMWAIGQMWPDDDKPEFFQLFYKGLKDAVGETAARALVKGLPAAAGLDVSGRLGLASNLNPLGFIPPDKQGSDYVAGVVMALAGPAVSMMANWAQALVVAKDDAAKAAELALPKFMADPVRAIDRYNRGVTNKRGDTLLSPEEFGPLGTMMRALGFEETKVTDLYDTRSAFMDAKKARDDVRRRIIRQTVDARMQGGDVAGMQEKITDFNSRHADDRITGANITAAIHDKRLTAQQLKEGVRIRKTDRQLARDLGIGQQ